MISAHSQDTIAAIATPPGVGALGIIRVSGPEAIARTNVLFPKKDLTKAKSHTLHFGRLEHKGQLLDEVLISLFRAPHSYTGEDSVEISCHGSPYILQKVMESLLEENIRLAEPGEFTLRAFLNGKLDLSQAEAVADLIASESEAAHQAALSQMRGGFSNKLKTLREELLHFASLLELELDFAEEDVEFADRKGLLNTLSNISVEVGRLASSFSLGNVIKSGVKTVIAGRPNAGKSTLLNALLEEERAIVSDIPGTTRDTIEDVITIDGIQFRFIDTAGIRSTEDTLENIGIQRTYEKLNEAQLIIYLFDVQELSAAELQSDLDSLPQDKPLLVVGNKIDRVSIDYPSAFAAITDILYISGRSGENLEMLKKKLVQAIEWSGLQPTDTIVTNVRHYRALQHILNSIQQAATGLTDGLPTDLVAMDIRHALQYMGEITGEITNDEILGNIFSKFCIGK